MAGSAANFSQDLLGSLLGAMQVVCASERERACTIEQCIRKLSVPDDLCLLGDDKPQQPLLGRPVAGGPPLKGHHRRAFSQPIAGTPLAGQPLPPAVRHRRSTSTSTSTATPKPTGGSGGDHDTQPAAALSLVGSWRHVRSENYGTFLEEVCGLAWGMRKIAERMPPTPTFTVEAGELCCTTRCLGGKPVRETLVPGKSSFHEPNLGHDYSVSAVWHGRAFVSARCCDDVNGGRPTVQSRWVDEVSGELVITHEWGGTARYTSFYTRQPVSTATTSSSSRPASLSE